MPCKAALKRLPHPLDRLSDLGLELSHCQHRLEEVTLHGRNFFALACVMACIQIGQMHGARPFA